MAAQKAAVVTPRWVNFQPTKWVSFTPALTEVPVGAVRGLAQMARLVADDHSALPTMLLSTGSLSRQGPGTFPRRGGNSSPLGAGWLSPCGRADSPELGHWSTLIPMTVWSAVTTADAASCP
jgi:hypothetical protein